MKAVALVVFCHLVAGCSSVSSSAVELFSSHCTSALTGQVVVLRVLATGDQLIIDERFPRRNYRVSVAGPDAADIRQKIATLELTPSDIETMASQDMRVRSQNGNDAVVLAPFDGVSYRFTIRGSQLVTVHNPASDPHFKSPPVEAVRLKAVLDLVEELSARARSNQRANKAPEPTSTSVMPRAIEVISESSIPTPLWNQARVTPAVAVAHL
jgi:hypothetical protein